MASLVVKPTGTRSGRLSVLETSVSNMGNNLIKFSDSLRALYRIRPEDLRGTGGEDLRKLRDGTKSDAIYYVNNVLPSCERLVQNISAFMEIYEDYTYEKWSKRLEYIIEEAETYSKHCEILKTFHEKISGIMKFKQDEAFKLEDHLRQLTLDNEGYKRRLSVESAVSGYSSLSWEPYTFMGIPYIIYNSQVKTLYKGAANRMQKQIDMDTKVLDLVVKHMIPALNAITDGFDEISAFFSVLSMELDNFNTKGKRACLEIEDSSDDVHDHFEAMLKHSTRIKSGCYKFKQQVPKVKSNLRSITSG